jgi:hypothetical protein
VFATLAGRFSSIAPVVTGALVLVLVVVLLFVATAGNAASSAFRFLLALSVAAGLALACSCSVESDGLAGDVALSGLRSFSLADCTGATSSPLSSSSEESEFESLFDALSSMDSTSSLRINDNQQIEWK